MPLPKTQTGAQADLAHIQDIPVSGEAAYGVQVCTTCGNGWPWAVFGNKIDGSRDHSIQVCIRCSNPAAEQIRWSMLRNEMTRYIQEARKQVQADGPDSPIPTVILGKDRHLGLELLKTAQERERAERALQPPSPSQPSDVVRSRPSFDPVPALNFAANETPETMAASLEQVANDATVRLQGQREAAALRQQQKADRQKRREEALAARQAATQEKLQARQADVRQEQAMKAHLEEQRRMALHVAKEQQRQLIMENKESRQQQQQQNQRQHTNGQSYALPHAQAVLQLPGRHGLTRLNMTNAELGLLRVPEPQRSQMWIQQHYTVGNPSPAEQLSQAPVYRRYASDITRLQSILGPQVQAALGIQPPAMGRDFVPTVSQVYPEAQNVQNPERDQYGNLTGGTVYAFLALVERQPQNEGGGALQHAHALAQAQGYGDAPAPDQAQGGGRGGMGPSPLGQAGRIVSGSGSGFGTSPAHSPATPQFPIGNRPSPANGPSSNVESANRPAHAQLQDYVNRLPSFSPATNEAELPVTREIARVWLESRKPYYPHGRGTFGQRLHGPPGHVLVYDDDYHTIWDQLTGSLKFTVDRTSSGGASAGTAKHPGSASAARPSNSKVTNGRLQPTVLNPMRSRTSSSTPSANVEIGSNTPVTATKPGSSRVVTAPRFSTLSSTGAASPSPWAVGTPSIAPPLASTAPGFGTPTPTARSTVRAPRFSTESRASPISALLPGTNDYGGSTSAPASSSRSAMPLSLETTQTPPLPMNPETVGPVIKGKGIQIIELDTSRFTSTASAHAGPSDTVTTDPFDVSASAPSSQSNGLPLPVASSTPDQAAQSDWLVLQRRTQTATGGEGHVGVDTSTIVTPSMDVLRRAGVELGEEEDLEDVDMVIDLEGQDMTRK